MNGKTKMALAAVAIATMAPLVHQNAQAFPWGNGADIKTCWHNGSQYAHVPKASTCPLSGHDSHFVIPGKVGVPKDEPGQYCFYGESGGQP